jgi:hypothetical protein
VRDTVDGGRTSRFPHTPSPGPLRGHAAPPPLRGVSEIPPLLPYGATPVFFVSATAFNLLGIDRWVPTFRYLNYYDSFDGYHPNVFVPRHASPPAFESIDSAA